MHLVVGIATTGRPAILSETIAELGKQTRLPHRIVICPAGDCDLPESGFGSVSTSIDVVWAGRGLCCQRNAILEASMDADIVVFFDDDFFPAPDYLSACEALFSAHADIAVATGKVVADGISGPGYTPVEAVRRLAGFRAVEGEISPTYGAYGCNMAIRMAAVREFGLRFDENLPLYGWQEDIDFSRQLAAYGRVVHASAMRGVHLGHKSGRSSGLRTGYSQIANIWYLKRKGTVSLRFGGRLALRNVLANIVRSVRGDAYVDRLGRLKGNIIAIADLFRGRCHPKRILDL